jgi:hypothetical protein
VTDEAAIDWVVWALDEQGGRATFSRIDVALVPRVMTSEKLAKAIGCAIEAGRIREAGRGHVGEGMVYEIKGNGEG